MLLYSILCALVLDVTELIPNDRIYIRLQLCDNLGWIINSHHNQDVVAVHNVTESVKTMLS